MSKQQQMRYNDGELSMIKNTFAGNDELLLAIRKVMLQFELGESDKEILKMIKGKEVQALLRKTFLPTLSEDAPRHQLIDLWMSIDVKDKSVADMDMIFKSREMLINLLDQQLKELEGKEVKGKIKLSDLAEYKGQGAEDFYPGIHARNTLISHVEMQLAQIEVLAGKKDESIEETKKRLFKDSAK